MRTIVFVISLLGFVVLPSLLQAQNVGIGSTVFTPNYLLQINHNAVSGTMFQLTNTTTGASSTDGFQIGFNTSGNTFQLNNREAGDISIMTNNVEKMRIMSDSGMLLAYPIDYVYHNFSSSKGVGGYGFRAWNGRMQYKHKGGFWADFPTMPNIPGNVEWWIRPTAASYIRPMYNPYIRVYDTLQTYGLYFDGAKNQYGGWFRTTGSYTPTAAVVGFSDVAGNQTYSYLGYNGSYSFGTPSQTINGSAVYGVVDDPDRTAGFFRTTLNASVAANINFSNVWIANYNYVVSSSTSYNPDASYSQLDVTANIPGLQSALMTYSGFAGTGNPGWSIGARLQAIGVSQDAIGVFASASGLGSGAAPTTGYSSTVSYSAGGYFQGNGNWAFVSLDAATDRKIIGTGTVSEIISTPDHGRITLTCPESPEYWYVDYGTVSMINGRAHVDLDPILIDICFIDEVNPLKVICQPNMEYCNGVAVINKTAKGFDIVEMNGGTHSGEIDFQIIAKPKTNYGEGRFPQAPGPAWLKADKEPTASKAENQTTGKDIFKWKSDWETYGYNPEDCVKIGDVIPAGPNMGKVKLGNGQYGNVSSSKTKISQ